MSGRLDHARWNGRPGGAGAGATMGRFAECQRMHPERGNARSAPAVALALATIIGKHHRSLSLPGDAA